MNAIIPVAGLGKRLRPQTWSRPKPLVSVAGKPVLGHVLERLETLGLDRVVFVTGYLGEQIEEYVRQEYDFESVFVTQDEPRGQSHAIIQAREYVTGPTMILFPDMLFEADLRAVKDLTNDGALFVKEVDDPRKFGVVVLENESISRLVEKPENPVSNLAVVGIYHFNEITHLFDAIDYQMKNNLKHEDEFYIADAIQHMISKGARFSTLPVSVWEDCGSPEALLSANRYLLDTYATDVPSKSNNVFIPPVIVDQSAEISNCVIGPYASIGANVRITSSIVRDAIVDNDAMIDSAMLSDSIVGRDAMVKGRFMRVNVGDSSDVILTNDEKGSGND